MSRCGIAFRLRYLSRWMGVVLVFGIMIVGNSCEKGCHNGDVSTKEGGIAQIVVSPDRTRVLMTIGYHSRNAIGGIWVSDICCLHWRKLFHVKEEQSIVLATWSPNGKSICFSGGERRGEDYSFFTAIVDTANGVFRLLTDKGAGNHAEWSPTGNTIAQIAAYGETYQQKILLIDVDKNEERVLLDDIAYWGSWGWMPDGRNIIFSPSAGTDAEIRIIDIHTLDQKVVLEGFVLGTPAFSSDGKKFFFSKNNSPEGYFIASLNSTGKWETYKVGDESLRIGQAIWAPDNGNLLLCARDIEKDTLWIMDTRNQKKKKILEAKVYTGFGFYAKADWLSDSTVIFSDGISISTINSDGSERKEVFSIEQLKSYTQSSDKEN